LLENFINNQKTSNAQNIENITNIIEEIHSEL